MSKVNVKVILKTNEEVTENIYQAIQTEQKIIYQDSAYKVTVLFNYPKLIRENDEYLLEMEFQNKEKTISTCFLKTLKKDLKLDIITENLIVEKDLLIVQYRVFSTEQTVLFRLEVLHD